MKKNLWKITLATALGLSLCVLTACGGNADSPSGNNDDSHTHTWGEYVSVSDQGHVQVCTECKAQSAPTLHVFSDDSDPDCNDCGFTREISAPAGNDAVPDNAVAVLACRYEDDNSYDQDLILYDDGTYDLKMLNMPSESTSGTYTIEGEEFSMEIWGDPVTGTVVTNEKGEIIELDLDFFGELTVYKKLGGDTVTLGYRDPNDESFDQNLVLHADGTYDLLFPSFPDENITGESYTVDDGKITLNNLWGETCTGDLITDANGEIVEVRLDLMGELAVYKKLGDDTVTLSYRDPNDAAYDQDLILYADGTYDLLFVSFPDDSIKGESYTVNGDKITLNNLWGANCTGTATMDENGTIIAVDIEVMGEQAVYKALD